MIPLLLQKAVAQSLSGVWLFVTPWTAAHQSPLSSSISQSLLKFMCIESVMLSNHLLCFHLLLWPSVFPFKNSNYQFDDAHYNVHWLKTPETCCCCVLSHFSRVQFFTTLWTVACQVPLSKGFSRQEYWSGWPCPPPGNIPNLGIKPTFPMSTALAGKFFAYLVTWEAQPMMQLN